MSFKRAYWLTMLLLLLPIILGASVVPRSDPVERVREFTRTIEFDYVTWTWDSLAIKLGQFALGTADYLPLEKQSSTVLEMLDLVRQINKLEAQISDIYGDPGITDPAGASADLRKELDALRQRRPQLELLSEAILQHQVSTITAQVGLTFLGQAFPPVMFHTTPLPDALIISPREVIRQDQDISIAPDMSADEMDNLENQVDKALHVSSLVVQVGGIGVYPTMVMETTDINFLAEVVAHEWVHNYLTLRPLGFSYLNSPELRTMNETVAAIAGKELGRMIIAQYYPEYLPPAPSLTEPSANNNQAITPPVFDFNREMHLTRVNTDQLLAEGKIDAAESYMEQRRQVFWSQGYHIRKLNQAYFAFFGAYGDQPGGAAGEDPVGAAVRLLREKSSSLREFINRIAWMWNFEQLEKAVGG